MQDETNFWYYTGVSPPIPGQLDNFTGTNFNPLPFLEEIIPLYLLKRVANDMGG